MSGAVRSIRLLASLNRRLADVLPSLRRLLLNEEYEDDEDFNPLRPKDFQADNMGLKYVFY
jgi:hypothetical protein